MATISSMLPWQPLSPFFSVTSSSLRLNRASSNQDNERDKLFIENLATAISVASY